MFSAAELDTARQFLRQQQPDAAWQALSPLLKREPDHVDALLLAGRIFLALDQPTVARVHLIRAAALRPRLHGAQFLLGFCLYVDNDFSPAVAPLEAARRLQPEDGATLLYLALTYEGLARTDEALVHYPGAVRRSLGAEAPLAFARLLFTLGRYPEAQQQVNEALMREPRSREVHYEMARLHLELGRPAQAAASGELALQLDGLPQTIRAAHFLLARVYQQLGRADRARQHRKAFEAIPPRLVR